MNEQLLEQYLALFIHKLKNPVHGLGLNIDVLQARIASLPEKTKDKFLPHMAAVQKDLARLQLITSRFMEFIAPMALNPKKIDLAQILQKSLVELATYLPGNIKLELDGLDRKIRLHIDEKTFLDGLRELYVNSIDAMPAGGKLLISITDGTPGTIIIADRGTGIPGGDLKKVFEPFYTTKQKAGMGLPLAEKFLGASNCTLKLKGSKDGGIMAVINLPDLPVKC